MPAGVILVSFDITSPHLSLMFGYGYGIEEPEVYYRERIRTTKYHDSNSKYWYAHKHGIITVIFSLTITIQYAFTNISDKCV